MNLILFFTYKTSIEDWINSGIFSREVKLYKELSDTGKKITFISYDHENYSDSLSSYNIRHIPIYKKAKDKKSNLKTLIACLKILFFQRDTFSKSDIFKTNQLSGSWIAILCKIFFRKPLFVRTGYDLYEFSIRNKKSDLKR